MHIRSRSEDSHDDDANKQIARRVVKSSSSNTYNNFSIEYVVSQIDDEMFWASVELLEKCKPFESHRLQ